MDDEAIFNKSKQLVQAEGIAYLVRVPVDTQDLEAAHDACKANDLFGYFSEDEEEAARELLHVAALWRMLSEEPLPTSGQFDLLCEHGCTGSIVDGAISRFNLQRRPQDQPD